MKTLELRVSLAGTLENAARCLDAITAEALAARGIDPADEGAEGDPRFDHQPDYYASALREIARHARGLRAGVHAAADFTRFYDLDPDGPTADPLVLALAHRVADQSELLSRRAGRRPAPLAEADYCPLGAA